MNKTLNKADLNSAIVVGGGLRSPRKPNVFIGKTENGYEKGDILDANAVIDVANEVIGLSPEDLDTIKELADAIGDDPQFAEHIDERIGAIEDVIPTAASDDNQLADKQYIDDMVSNWQVDVVNGLRDGKEIATEDFVDSSINTALTDAIQSVEDEIVDNEETTAAALNELNDRIEEDSNVIAGSLNDLNDRELTDDEVVAAAFNDIQDDEFVAAAAIADILAKIDNLTSRIAALEAA